MFGKIRPSNDNVYHEYKDINICPVCHKGIHPIVHSSRLHFDKSKLSIYAECPACGNPFIILFSKSAANGKAFDTIKYVAPDFPEEKEFDEHIKKISNNFIKIYNEAKSAETYGLNNIAGMGYRKAFEFLIKDYCISKNPNVEEIKKMPLAQVIDKYVESNRLKNLSKASVWVGNDETHYIRKFEDKDIKDLKTFINATVSYINYELISDDAEELISSKSSS